MRSELARFSPKTETLTKMKRYLLLVIITCSALLNASLVCAQDVQAFIWDSANGLRALGSLGGDSYATGINDSGQVVGYSYLSDQFTTHSFIWTEASGMVDIGGPGGFESIALAINSAGNICGLGTDTQNRQVAFYWTPSGGFNVFTNGGAYGINNHNEVTGQFPIGGTANHAFVWSPTMRRPLDVGTLAGGSNSYGDGINNLRHVTGFADDSTGAFQAFAWKRGRGFLPLGFVPRSTNTGGYGINDRDEIVGAGYTNSGGVVGFYVRTSGQIELLQTLGGGQSAGIAINQTGIIAGYATLPSELSHATIWSTPTSAPQDLGALGGNDAGSGAGGINNVGQVVGWTAVSSQ
jgi:probable HAF family extracellular repeat protein